MFSILDTSVLVKSGHNFFVKKNSVKVSWNIKKSLILLKPPVLINISGSGNSEFFKNLEKLKVLFLDNLNFLAALIISSLPL